MEEEGLSEEGLRAEEPLVESGIKLSVRSGEEGELEGGFPGGAEEARRDESGLHRGRGGRCVTFTRFLGRSDSESLARRRPFLSSSFSFSFSNLAFSLSTWCKRPVSR